MAPEGAPLDIERFFDVASPDGAAITFDTAWPGDIASREQPLRRPAPGLGAAGLATRPEPPVQPPEYLSSVGGPEEARLLDAPRPGEPPAPARPDPPDPPGFAQPQEPRGREPRAPGQSACTQDAYYVFPPVEPFLFAPDPPEQRGKGGADDTPKVDAQFVTWADRCPCVCHCVHFARFVNVFVLVRKLLGSFLDLFGRDTRSLLGVSAGPPVVVVSTPDGLVEQVRDLLVRRNPVSYGAASSNAPGSAAPADGLSPAAGVAGRAPSAPQRLLWPELDGTLVLRIMSVAPVGPGPGLLGIGAQPLVPASGSRLRAAPGSLPAGFAPASDPFGPGLGRDMP